MLLDFELGADADGDGRTRERETWLWLLPASLLLSCLGCEFCECV